MFRWDFFFCFLFCFLFFSFCFVFFFFCVTWKVVCLQFMMFFLLLLLKFLVGMSSLFRVFIHVFRVNQCGVWRFYRRGSPMWGLKIFMIVSGLGQDCVAVRYLTPYFGYLVLPHVDLAGAMPCPKKVHKKYKKREDRNRQETKNFSFRLSFIYLMNGLTNATSKDIAWCPKHQIVKTVLSVRRHYPKRERFTENLSIYLSLPAPNSPLPKFF